MFIGGGGIPRDVCGVPLEEIRHEHAIFLLIRGGQDIGTLDGLVKEPEDIWVQKVRDGEPIVDPSRSEGVDNPTYRTPPGWPWWPTRGQ